MERNNLYPIFLKLEKLNVLIIGGGSVAEEKLRFLLKSSPGARVKMVAPFYRNETKDATVGYDVRMIEKVYETNDLEESDLIIVATNDKRLNQKVYLECKERNLLVNVADCPSLCDFYLGGIVTKGNLKIGISTNGKSPTAAKRLRQFFEEILPDEIDELLVNLNRYRETLSLDLEKKISELNNITKGLVSK